MGGNAFKNIKLKRINPTDYNNIKNHVINLLQPYCKLITVPHHIQTKADFGDLDILYLLDTTEISNNEFVALAEKLFNSEEVHYTKGCPARSFHFNISGFPEFQVDLISTKNENDLKFQQFYLSHSDFGSIVGQICSCMGYTFSDTNLKLKVFYNNNPAANLGTIELTNNIEKVCEFLGYDSNRLKDPFSTEEEFFTFMSQGKLFKPEFFNMEKSFNHTHRKRASKRPVYTRFMEFVAKEFEATDPELIDKPGNKLIAAKHFGVLKEYNQMLSDHERRLEYKQKLNGDVVKKCLPIFVEKIRENRLNGKVLGRFMDFLKDDLTEEEVIGMGEQEIDDWVLRCFEDFKILNNKIFL